MTAELWQFGIMLAVFCVALILWLKIVYLPRRTLERWQDPDTKLRDSSSETTAEKLEVPDAPKGP